MSNAKQRRKRANRGYQAEAVAALNPVPANAPRRRVDDPATWGEAQQVTQLAAGKVMQPPVENMKARGLLSPEQCQAADEIRAVFHWITAGVVAKTFDPLRTGGKGSPSDALQAAYTERYKPWAAALSGTRSKPESAEDVARVLRSADNDSLALAAKALNRTEPSRGWHHPKTLAIVIAVVIDGRTLTESAKDEETRAAVAREAFYAGLTLYAEMAGWLRRAA